jgi:hypothetical protein
VIAPLQFAGKPMCAPAIYLDPGATTDSFAPGVAIELRKDRAIFAPT